MAKCYVRVGRRLYAPGEVLEIPAEKKDWLIKAGAVEEIAAKEEPKEEAPEIDVMAGIVKEPKTRRRKRKGATE